MPRLGLLPRISGIAGPASFQRRLILGLRHRGVEVTFEIDDRACDAVLVVGGTRALGSLSRARRRGLRVIQRLDGMNWIHRARPTGWRHSLRAELNNRLLRLIRDRFADALVYQSEFARGWWEREHGPAGVGGAVVHNGVPLDIYTPADDRPAARPERRVVVLEGAVGGGYQVGLTWAAGLAAGLAESLGADVRLSVAGARHGPAPAMTSHPRLQVEWLGVLPEDRVPDLLRSGDLLFSADVNPACPNSVIEALACGLPVAAFATGAIPEMVDSESGAVVPYGADPWKVETPDVDGLVLAAMGVLRAGERMRRGARRRAEAHFGLERMIDGYLEVLGW